MSARLRQCSFGLKVEILILHQRKVLVSVLGHSDTRFLLVGWGEVVGGGRIKAITVSTLTEFNGYNVVV